MGDGKGIRAMKEVIVENIKKKFKLIRDPSPEYFTKEVNQYLLHGWELYGFSYYTEKSGYCQPMIKFICGVDGCDTMVRSHIKYNVCRGHS